MTRAPSSRLLTLSQPPRYQSTGSQRSEKISMIISDFRVQILFYFSLFRGGGGGELRIFDSSHHHRHHKSLNREGRWGTTDNFATSFLRFSLFSTALWDLPNSRPVHSLMLSSHLFLCLPCLLPPFTVPCKMVLARPDERET